MLLGMNIELCFCFLLTFVFI